MSEPELRIELGAGARKMPGWTGIDISPKADLVCDIGTEVWPFADGSVREIYASHVLEHFSYLTTMRHVLDECLRVLCPGGRLRVAVPDASIYIRAYLEGRDSPEVIPVYKRAYFFNSPIDSNKLYCVHGGAAPAYVRHGKSAVRFAQCRFCPGCGARFRS